MPPIECPTSISSQTRGSHIYSQCDHTPSTSLSLSLEMKAACNYPPSTFLMSPSWKNLSHEKQSRKSCYATIRASSTKLANASTKLANGVASPTHLTDFTLTEARNQTQIQTGRFGKYGGKYVPELLISCLSRLEDEFYKALDDPKFKVISLFLDMFWSFWIFRIKCQLLQWSDKTYDNIWYIIHLSYRII